MKILGLTGSIACGKSTVAKWLKQYGAIVIDADTLVHELYLDPAFTAQIGQSFGTFVLGEDGAVNRKALGDLVFGNPHKMVKLEKIVHPAVTALRDQRVQEIRQSANPPEVLVLDAVKLVESGQYKICQAVWCMVVDRANQIDRLIHKRNLTHKEALQRIIVQPPSEKKDVQTDIPIIYIDNNGTVDELEQTVERLWQEFGENH
jgi:dephospho-CoA kinase